MDEHDLGVAPVGANSAKQGGTNDEAFGSAAGCLRQLNQIPGVSIPAGPIERRPNFPLIILAREDAMPRFISAMDWYLDEIRRFEPTRG